MYGKRLIEIGSLLGPVHKEIIRRNLEISLTKDDQERLKMTLIPEAGWPGTNDKQRDAARDQTYLVNERMIAARERLTGLQRELNSLLGDEAMLEDERRALEYAVRDRLASLLEVGEESGGDMDAAQLKNQVDNLSNTVQPQEQLGLKPSTPAASTPEGKKVDPLGPSPFGTPPPGISVLDINKAPSAPIGDVLGIKLEAPVPPAPYTGIPAVQPAPAVHPQASAPAPAQPDDGVPSQYPSADEVEDIIKSLGF